MQRTRGRDRRCHGAWTDVLPPWTLLKLGCDLGRLKESRVRRWAATTAAVLLHHLDWPSCWWWRRLDDGAKNDGREAGLGRILTCGAGAVVIDGGHWLWRGSVTIAFWNSEAVALIGLALKGCRAKVFVSMKLLFADRLHGLGFFGAGRMLRASNLFRSFSLVVDHCSPLARDVPDAA